MKHNGKARNGANSRSSTATHNGMSQQTTLQMSHSPNKSQYYDISRNGNRYGGGGAAGERGGAAAREGGGERGGAGGDHHR